MTQKTLNEELAASYVVTVVGIDRTRAELSRLDGEIKALRRTTFSSSGSATVASNLSSGDIFTTRFSEFESRVDTGVSGAMNSGMALGRRIQGTVLKQAVTETGLTRPGKGPGRNKTGKLIRAIKSNVESHKTANASVFVGWHGWRKDARLGYEEYQERGTKGRGQTSRTLASASGSVTRRKNKPYRYEYAGKRRAKGPGVPAANSLGASIIQVREHIKRQLKDLKR